MPRQQRHVVGESHEDILFAADSVGRRLVLIDTFMQSVIDTIICPGSPSAIGIDPFGRAVAVASDDPPAVSILDLGSDGSTVASMEIGAAPTAVRFSPLGDLFAVACEFSEELYVFSYPGCELLHTARTASGPMDAAWLPDGEHLLVACPGVSVVEVYRPYHPSPFTRRLNVAIDPVSIAVHPDGESVFVGCEQDGGLLCEISY